MVANAAFGFIAWLFQSLFSLGGRIAAAPFRITFLAFWFPVILFILFNAELLYGEGWERQHGMMLTYLVGLVFVFSLAPIRNPLGTMSAGAFIVWFLIAFAAGAFLFALLQPINPESRLFAQTAWGLLVFHGLVVAVMEELNFRFVMPWLLRALGEGPAHIVSALMFGVMHLSAYTLALDNPTLESVLPPIAFAAALGALFGWLNIRFREIGLVLGMGLHFAWNAYVLGFLTVI